MQFGRARASSGAALKWPWTALLAIALVNDLPVWSSGKIYVTHERVARIITISIWLS